MRRAMAYNLEDAFWLSRGVAVAAVTSRNQAAYLFIRSRQDGARDFAAAAFERASSWLERRSVAISSAIEGDKRFLPEWHEILLSSEEVDRQNMGYQRLFRGDRPLPTNWQSVEELYSDDGGYACRKTLLALTRSFPLWSARDPVPHDLISVRRIIETRGRSVLEQVPGQVIEAIRSAIYFPSGSALIRREQQILKGLLPGL